MTCPEYNLVSVMGGVTRISTQRYKIIPTRKEKLVASVQLYHNLQKKIIRLLNLIFKARINNQVFFPRGSRVQVNMIYYSQKILQN